MENKPNKTILTEMLIGLDFLREAILIFYCDMEDSIAYLEEKE